jgi:hypothetical protein
MANNQKMRYLIPILLCMGVALNAQITVNTNFLPNIASPIDTRQKIATLADTTTIPFQFVGAICYVTAKDSIYYKGTNGWKPIGKRGGSSSGTVTSVNGTGGTGISVTGGPITGSGSLTITNTAPDQTVSITGAGINVATGTYPNFTITGTELDGSVSNEIQSLSLLDSINRVFRLQISGGNTIKFKDTDTNSGGTITNIATNAPVTGGPITGTGTIGVDTTSTTGLATQYDLTLKQSTLVSGTNIKTVNSNSLLGAGNVSVGTVTNYSAGDLSPLFTTSEATTTTIPALTFAPVSQAANLVYASPNGTAGNPTFRAIVGADVPTLNQNTTGSAATLTTGRTIGITGDMTYTSPSFNGSANVTAAGTLATVNANVGTFTNSTITVNGKGLVTAASSGSAVTGESTTVTDSPTIDMTLTGYAVSGIVIANSIDSTQLKTSGVGTTDLADGVVKTAKIADLNVTHAKLQTSGVTASTYNNVTVNNKGIVTAGSNVAYLTSEVGDISAVTVSGPITGGGTTGSVNIALDTTSATGAATQYDLTMKQNTLVSGTNIKTVNSNSLLGSGNVSVGTVTSYSAGDLSPLFTTSEATATTTPALTFAPVSQAANLVYASPNGAAGNPTFRAIVGADVPTLNQNTTGSAATLTTGRTIGITGDMTYTSPSFNGSANVTAAGTLATVNANVGTFTNSTITVNGKGLITAASSGSAVTGESTTVTDSPTIDMTLTGYAVSGIVIANSIDSTQLKTSGVGTTDLADGVVKTAKIADLNVTHAKLQTSGVTASTYNNVTVNNKGIVTAGSNVAYLTSEADGSLINEGMLSVGVGGANSSSIVSNSLGSNVITISGLTGIGVTESGNIISITNTAIDSTVVNGGYGIDVVESPTNTYTLKADTAEVATTYDMTLKQNTLVSGTNIKTVNGNSLLGSGNVSVGTVTSVTAVAPLTGGAITGAGSIGVDTTSATGLATQHDLIGLGGVSGVAPRIPFFSTTTTLGNSADLKWDNTNSELEISNIPIGSNAANQLYVGTDAAVGATSADNSLFFGSRAGYNATGAAGSIFFGASAGEYAANATESNFMGLNAGNGATYASGSNFYGTYAGQDAVNASASNFFGSGTGLGATDATESNFFGNDAGQYSVNAYKSNFFSSSAGSNAANAYHSNFFGEFAGAGATGAYQSNMFGREAGQNASLAKNSNLFGYRAGWNNGASAIDSNNIIIGTNLTLPAGASNSMNLGGILFGTGTQASLIGNPRSTATSGGKIGIMTVAPTEALHVTGNARVTGAILDSNNEPGTSGQILSSTVTGTDWIPAPSGGGGGGTVTSITAVAPLTGGAITTSGSIGVDTTSATGLATQYDLTTVSGATNLSVSGTSSPLTLNSSTGSDVTLTAGTGITLAGGPTNMTVTNSAPDQTVVITGATGTYPNFTLPAEVGDISAVTVSGPITGGGTSGSVNIALDTTGTRGAATQYDLTLKQNALVSGTSIKTVNGNSLLGSGNVSVGTVTSVGMDVSASGTDITIGVGSSPVTSTGTINLNIPTASATNRGALSSANWSTFNSKVGGSSTSSYLAYWNGTSTVTGSANLYYASNTLNIASGRLALSGNGGAWNVFVNGGNTTLSGASNIGIGSNGTLANLTSGANNISLGIAAGQLTTTGNNNVNLGVLAGYSNVTGGNNMFIGSQSGYTVTGSDNVFIGGNSGYNCGSGAENTGIGSFAGYSGGGSNVNIGFYTGFNATGNYNTKLGRQAGENSGTGTGQIAIGFASGQNNTGNYTTAIGYQAGATGDGEKSIFIGYQAGFSETGANRLHISNNSGTTTGIFGDFSTNAFGVNMAPSSMVRNWNVGGTMRVSSLDTDGSAPTTTGTTRMMICDDDGDVSFSTTADLSITNEGYLGVATNGSVGFNDALLRGYNSAGTATGNGVTIEGGTGIAISEATGVDGGLIKFELATVYGSLVAASTASMSITGTDDKEIDFSTDLSSSGITLNATLDRMTVANAGVYEIDFSCSCAGNGSASQIFHKVKKNGSTTVGPTMVADILDGKSTAFAGKRYVSLLANDYVEVFSNSGSGTVNVFCNNVYFSIKRL